MGFELRRGRKNGKEEDIPNEIANTFFA